MNSLPTTEDLSAVAQIMDPSYPDGLREVTELLFLELVQAEPSTPDQARSIALAQLALRQTERLSVELGGTNFYMHKATSYRLSPRNRQMCAEFRGDYKLLARKYKLTEQQVRNIVDAWQREQFARRQGSLLLDPVEPD